MARRAFLRKLRTVFLLTNANMTDLTHRNGAGEMIPADMRTGVRARAIVQAPSETMARWREGAFGEDETLGAARIAGMLAAKRAGDLIPHAPSALISKVTVAFALGEDGIGVESCVVGETGAALAALTAASVAALTLLDRLGDPQAVIVRIGLALDEEASADPPVEGPGPTLPPAPPPVRLASRGFRRAPGALPASPVRPALLDKGEATPRATHNRAESFREFLRANRLQASSWAAQAGLPVGLIYGFLHGRVGRLPRDAEEKLAKAANASVREVFGED